MELFPATNGEHQYAYYNEDATEVNDDAYFFDKSNHRITNFYRLPSFKEIHELEYDYEEFK